MCTPKYHYYSLTNQEKARDMAIFRCNKCGHIREVSNELTGRSVRCPKCKQPAPIHDAVTFVEKVLQRYMTVYKELQQLKQHIAQPEELTELSEIYTIPSKTLDLSDVDVHNTTAMTKRHQYEPILTWFQARDIQVEVDQKAIDTTGFFDEVAISLGENYKTLKKLLDQIKYVQRKGYSNVKLVLAKNSQKEIKTIRTFCQELYNYSFVAKYFYHKKDKVLRLDLQKAKAIVNFFNGEWLEWYVFMTLLNSFRERSIHASCLRSFTVTFPNEDLHELDVFFLLNKSTAICIECKSGEFRDSIEKYTKLRRRLSIEKSNFILLALGLSDEQAQGLSSMYDMTFLNEKNFSEHINTLIKGSR